MPMVPPDRFMLPGGGGDRCERDKTRHEMPASCSIGVPPVVNASTPLMDDFFDEQFK